MPRGVQYPIEFLAYRCCAGGVDMVSVPLALIKNNAVRMGNGFLRASEQYPQTPAVCIEGWLLGEVADKRHQQHARVGATRKAVFGFVMTCFTLSTDHVRARLKKRFSEDKYQQMANLRYIGVPGTG